MNIQTPSDLINSMETRTVSTPNGDGIVLWQDNNETAVILDDGLDYIFDDADIADCDDTAAQIRRNMWQQAHSVFTDHFEAVDYYSHAVVKWRTMVDNAGKTCTKCQEFKPFGKFHINEESPDGYRNDCKACRKGN